MENNTTAIHLNRAQLEVNVVAARDTMAVLARGTGKTEGILAPAQHRNAMTMPRSLGVNVGATFAQILTRTLPAIVKGWEKLGYRRDEHYFIGHYAPKAWGWNKPYFAPIDPKYTIHWFTGAAIQLVSQDGYGMANGISADYIHGDEAKLLNHEKLKSELLPVNRGNNQYFGHLSQHHSLLFTTDLPTSSRGQWILDKANQCDRKLVNLIIEMQYKINEIRSKMHTYTESTYDRQHAHIEKLERQIALLRMNCVHYIEASALVNIDVLGLEYFKQMKRNLSPFDFQTSILNQKVRSTDKSFYPLFDEHIHTYEKYNSSYFEEVGYNFDKLIADDCRADGDLIPSEALDISIDYGASINIMAVGQQRNENQEDIIKEFFVLTPKILDDLLLKFIAYYRFHKMKVVNYFYDHTAVGKSGMSSKSYRDVVAETLTRAGWTVNHMYMGQAPGHENKHRFWAEVMREENPGLPKFRMNRGNCPSLKKSMEDAPWKQSEDGFKKDKSSEKNDNYPQEFATHGSDAVDQLMWGKFKSGFTKEESGFMPNMTM